MSFDPDSSALADGIFGLPDTPEAARFVVIGAPFDATTSYRQGTRHGPTAIFRASVQVELLDADFGRTWEQGIVMLPIRRPPTSSIARLNREAGPHARLVHAVGGPAGAPPRRRKSIARAVEEVDRRSHKMNLLVEQTVGQLLEQGKVPIVLGGEHAVAFGAIKAYSRRFPGLGVLQIDAHADLRDSYEGFAWSHAGLMHNVAALAGDSDDAVSTIVQVGLREICVSEQREMGRGHPRIVSYTDSDLRAGLYRGRSWSTFCDRIVSDLPENVYISLDIDGLDPALCPDTGTPVPGGLAWNELLELLKALVRSPRTIVGFDLCEVAPSPSCRPTDWGKDWNAIVGARLLYKLIGACSSSGKQSKRRSSHRRMKRGPFR